MGDEPTLIIQMQRMGDLLLSFPLCSHLLMLEPTRPVWVVAEKAFFSELMPLAPGVVFFDPTMAPQLRTARYHRIINLSHRAEALELAGSLHAGEHIGAFRHNGIIHIKGDWRLYRHSIVGNNRHNLFHWADLEALGLVPPRILASTVWPPVRTPARTPAQTLETGQKKSAEPSGKRQTGRIGLFVGASEKEKRPEPLFWGELARLLLRRGFHPLLLGGPGERELATEAARIGGLPEAANLAGRFRLSELASFMLALDLVVTPDTGPMHLAAWVGVPILNLSMGPVNAYETGPAPPGHLVLRSTGSCVGCWRCNRTEAHCRLRFHPGNTAGLVAEYLRSRASGNERFSPQGWRRTPGVRLYRTGRDARGLFVLSPLSRDKSIPAEQRTELAAFWREWFLAALGGAPHRLDTAIADLEAQAPHLVAPLRQNAARLVSELATGLRRGHLPDNFWHSFPPLVRPLSGYLHLLLENGDFAPHAWTRALTLAEHFAGVF